MQLIKNTTHYAMIALGLLLFSAAGMAQPAPTVHHPGDVVTITIVFDGVDAHKLQTAFAYFSLLTLPKDQPGFSGSLNFTDNTKPDSPGIFKLSQKIASNAASGIYRLTQIRAGTSGEGPISILYDEGLPALSLTIENDRKFVKPTLKSVKEP